MIAVVTPAVTLYKRGGWSLFGAIATKYDRVPIQKGRWVQR
jgi:hypothetical protein